MTQEEITDLARESGLWLYGLGKDQTNFQFMVSRFASLLLDAEREACAKICEQMQDWPEDATPYDCAAAIRARGEK
jgi:hypothetical protein